MSIARILIAGLLCWPAGAGWTQTVEFGFSGGGSLAAANTVQAPFGQASAGFEHGFSAGVWGGHNHRYLGGEIRYVYEQDRLRVASGGTLAAFSGRSHAIHYSLLVHTRPAGSKTRPFLAAGGGVKGYQGTGTEVLYQPLQEYALLTRTSEWKGLLVFGGGVKFALSPRLQLRAEVYDYLTPFPDKVIAPAPGAAIGGWVHSLVPAFGFGLTF
jgi:hypothetical protein